LHAFIVVARKPGKRVPGHVLDLLRRGDIPDLYFEPESHVDWSNTARDVHFAGWQAATDVFDIGSHWNVADDGLTAFAGHLFPMDGGWTGGDSWAAQLSRRLRRRPLAQSLESFRGVFSAVSLESSGGGCIASDPLGLGLIYVAETDEFMVFSNRAGLAASAITPPHRTPMRDPIGVGWLVYCGNIIGNATGFAGVRAIPPGNWAELDPVHGPVLRERSDPPWQFGDSDGTADADQLISLVRDDIAAALRTIVDLPGPQRRADITGGKDSRLILALLISEGLADKVDFRTFGAPSLPDVVIGKDVAQRFGLAHQAHTPEPLSGDDFEQRLRIHTFRTSGMLGAWDLKFWPIRSIQSVYINGLCGEILRCNYPDYRDISTTDHLLRAFQAGMPFDKLDLIKPDLRARYDQEAADSLLAGPWNGDEPLDLMDVFFLKNRLRRWSGTEQETDCSNRLFPLYSLIGMRTAFAIGHTRRRSAFIHFEVIRRCSEELAKLPLANAQWAEELVRDLPDAEEFRATAPEAPQDQQRGPARQWQELRLEQNKDVFQKFLATDPAHPVFEVIDRDVAVAAVDNAQNLTYQQRVQLYGAVTAAIWLGEEELSARVPAGSVAW
jgi:hypothetical protein